MPSNIEKPVRTFGEPGLQALPKQRVQRGGGRAPRLPQQVPQGGREQRTLRTQQRPRRHREPRQLLRLCIATQARFVADTASVLPAGLTSRCQLVVGQW
jgi:hypothetical protein